MSEVAVSVAAVSVLGVGTRARTEIVTTWIEPEAIVGMRGLGALIATNPAVTLTVTPPAMALVTVLVIPPVIAPVAMIERSVMVEEVNVTAIDVEKGGEMVHVMIEIAVAGMAVGMVVGTAVEIGTIVETVTAPVLIATVAIDYPIVINVMVVMIETVVIVIEVGMVAIVVMIVMVVVNEMNEIVVIVTESPIVAPPIAVRRIPLVGVRIRERRRKMMPLMCEEVVVLLVPVLVLVQMMRRIRARMRTRMTTRTRTVKMIRTYERVHERAP